MGRKPVLFTNEHPYHVTARSNNQDWFDVPMNYCYGVFSNVLEKTIDMYKINLHGFVLMNNHFHMIVSTPEKNIGLALRYLMTETSRGIRYKSKRVNHIYGGRNYKSVIKSSAYYAHCIKYLYRNPVKAGIVDRVEDYHWSTLSSTKRKPHDLITEINLGHDELLPASVSERVDWYNIGQPKSLEEQVQRAIRRSEFHFKTCRQSRKKIDEFKELYNAGQRPQVPDT